MGSCAHCREVVSTLRMNRFKILRLDKECDLRKVRLPAPIVVYF
jgi:hypothetical protein